MRVCHTIEPVFDDPSLVSFGGLPAVMRLGELAGLYELVAEHVRVPGSAGANPGSRSRPWSRGWSLGPTRVTMLLSFVVGMVLGALAAWKRNSVFDSVVTLGSTFIGTLQAFWIALLLLFAFGYILGWFPTSGGYDASTPGLNAEFLADAVYHSVLPAAVLLLLTPIGWILGMRNTMIMNLGEDYIRLAKAKGVPDRQVALRYATRNALLPSITGFAMALGGPLGGQLLIEQTFDYPGLGRIMGQAATSKDYPLLQALLLFTIVGTLLANLIADMLYGVLDPRARKASS